ncbi:amino acid ABC transporter substrate-binding protein [Chitinimonas arctica]|uniref:Amino acid ABC transporter substrate-binding protein n=1 Tax=Chitinimonas arctica TaxID=2594795 RepID=A0A516SCC2_9NEIS|nr:transporter substrate-binding domain-containing protein [Chitinimonas arctica]QDQ25796.1 amino acid ABC transporter substrate-binding protein [Chitinimonas arctica]
MHLAPLRLLFAASILGGSLMALAADKPASLTVCSENEESYPWILKDKPGLNTIMMRMVEKQLGVKIDIKPLPWKRCMESLRTGEMDGLFKISFKPDRMEMGHFPMSGDKPDGSKRMLDDSYSLYRLKGSNVEWDGKAIKNAQSAIGAQSGFSIVDQLKGLGVRVDDGVRGAGENLQKLVNGRLSGVALQTLEGDINLAERAEFAAKIERIDPPLVSKPYFLMLSKQFVAKYPEFAQQIWNAVGTVRESAEYKNQLKQFK